MRKFILPAILAAAVGFAFLPSNAQASWLSQAIHPRDDAGRYAPAYHGHAAPGYNPGDYTQPVYPGYNTDPRYYPNGYNTLSRDDARDHDEWRGRDDHGDRHDDRGHDDRDNRDNDGRDHRR